ncbi:MULTISPECIES: ribosome maturation factor RimM [unclassified Beijerinckia]|uniref:ribosome maturation factor RimM n=1 Tax=unclassified Beijerinckia TaxID=2638183 RepID=UPI00089CB48F|nr:MULTISPECIES: ribosome maturation factor RimM [unclassified Beijerinckia]MDH7798243.1 16S rRNA processing protein RimM [Beijerinckia sp. GAS462]SED14176.1 16S rRNA processing protein RimM [Beijerinckia sp. 28-YEA-48]
MAAALGGRDGNTVAPASGLVLVGRFGAPHGVRGEIRIKSYTGDPLALAGYSGLTDATGTRSFALKRARPVKDDMIVGQVDGVGDRNAAEALVNLEIFVPRANLPAPDEDEFYFSDLIGLAVLLPDGSTFGKVRAVDNFGAGDILMIETATGDEALLPFTKAVVPKVDIAGGAVHVILPEEIEGEPESPPTE